MGGEAFCVTGDTIEKMTLDMQKKALESANFRFDMCRKGSVFESLL